MLAEKAEKSVLNLQQKDFFLHISFCYAKILGETNFGTWEIPRSGSKAEDGEEKRRKKRAKVGDNSGQATHGARRHAWRTQAAWAKTDLMNLAFS